MTCGETATVLTTGPAGGLSPLGPSWQVKRGRRVIGPFTASGIFGLAGRERVKKLRLGVASRPNPGPYP
jgi:hypothetical protein